jgi:hypothetical protein
MLGVDSSTYHGTRLYIDQLKERLAKAEKRVAPLESRVVLGDITTNVAREEVLRERKASTRKDSAFTVLHGHATDALALPVRKLLLLDPNFYKGTGVGAAVVLLLKFVVLR